MTDATPNPQLTIRGQYIKDLSFEAPKGPFTINQLKEAPLMDVNVDLEGTKVGDDLYEMTLKISVRAASKEETIFVTELAYGGVFQMENAPEDRIQPMLFIDCPFILFPFARRVLADVTRDGGFPPLMLEPIDFHALFVKRVQEDQAKAKAEAS
ncbi:MAG: protein-export chaperone SecB [Rickettsiales bacterium]|nr:protein-export chaperone SecB [Rickettsiales bacterium]